MKIALGQMKISKNINENLKKTISFIKKASENNADLICFSELQLTPFFPQYPKRDVNEYLMHMIQIIFIKFKKHVQNMKYMLHQIYMSAKTIKIMT